MLDKIETFSGKHHMFPKKSLILAAVSGGADSVCLFHALLELRGQYGFDVAAVHFNHMLRGAESERDEQFVKQLCLEKGTPFFTARADVARHARDNGSGVEETARQLRYDFFNETAKKCEAVRIATAHTADDNAETVLFNLTRGTGLKGLGGIPPVRGNIIRPMLTVTRDEVLGYISQHALSFVEDSTNATDQYSRNRIRHRVIPVLKSLNPRFSQNLGLTAALIREDEDYLSGLAERFINDNVYRKPSGEKVFAASTLGALPHPIAARVIRHISDVSLSSEHINAVLDLSQSENVSGEVHLPSTKVYREYDRLIFSELAHEPVHSPAGFNQITLSDGVQAFLPELGLRVSCNKVICNGKINKSFTTFLFKFDNICGNIVIRPRETGDIIGLYGRNGTKSLKKLFIEKKIPVRNRPLTPVVADSKGVLAVYGLGFDKRAACKAGEFGLKIVFEEATYE